MNNKNPWKKLSSKVVYQNKYYQVREDRVIRPTGEEGLYAVVELPPAVFIVPLTETFETYLVGQYRYTTDEYSWELPGGGSENQDLLESAKKELQEETGLTAEVWEQIGSFRALNGATNERDYVFIAKGLTQTNENKMAEEGITQIKKISFKQAFDMIKSGEITDSQTIAALTQAGLFLNLVKI